MSGDPMLDGITRYTMLVEVDYMGAGKGIAAEPNPDGGWINAADLPALLAKVREDAVRDYAEAHYANKMQRGEERYEQGQRDEREACIAVLEATRSEFFVMHSGGWHRFEHAIAAIRAREEKS